MRFDLLQQRFLVYEKGGSSAPTQTTQVNQMYSPEEAARRAKIMAEAERIYGTTSGTAANQGPLAQSPQTLQAQQMLGSQATGGMTDIANMMPWAMDFGMKGVLDPTSNPGFQATLDTAGRKVTEAYSGPTGPFANIRSGFTAGNSGGSGTREGIAMGMAGRDYLNTMGDVTGKLTSDAYTKGLDVFSRTLASAPTAMSAMQAPGATMSQVGQQNDLFQQAQREWELQAPWASFGPYASTMAGMSGPSGTTTTQTGSTGAQNNPLATSAGYAMMGASMFPANPLIGAGAGLALSLFL